MYQDAYNTLMKLFKSGLISNINLDKDGIILAVEEKNSKLRTFENIQDLLEWMDKKELETKK